MSRASGETETGVPSFYDGIADTYDEQMARMPGDAWVREAFRDFVTRDLPAGAVLLDFGCGTGIDARAYAERGFRVIGYDASPGMARVARERCRTDAGGALAEIVTCPYEEFLRGPWPADSPSAIASNFAVLNLVPSLRDAFARFHGLLQPGGSVSLSLLNPCHVRNLVTPGLRRTLVRALVAGVAGFPDAKVPTLLYRERVVREAARSYFTLERRAGIGAIVNYGAIAGSWRAPLGLRERIERRFFATRAMAFAGKFMFLRFRRAG